MTAWLIGLGIACIALIIIYMTRPPFKPHVVSSARFFNDLPPAKDTCHLGWGKPLLSRSFWLQLFILANLIVALLSFQKTIASGETVSLGVWIIVDTSASMSTIQGGDTRMVAARQEIDRIIAQAKEVSGDIPPCIGLSSFDLELKHRVSSDRDALDVRQAVAGLEPRPLGTDLTLVRALTNSLESGCTVSHFVVVSDLPAPAWVADDDATRMIWRDVGSAVDNVGFTTIQGNRHPLTGLVREITVEITAFGKAPSDTKLDITARDGSPVFEETLAWTDDNTWQGTFSAPHPGRYILRISPGGAYGYDDEAVIDVADGEAIRVDWRLDDHSLPVQLGWLEDQEQPHFHVIPHSHLQQSEAITRPILIVGSGYRQAADGPIEILDFYEPSPLLADLNFDVAESLAIQGITLPKELQPVLRGVDGLVWLAQRDDPPVAYVPGLPTGGDDNLGRFSTTAFFNAVRWLLQERPVLPLYTLTGPEPANLEPEGNRLALHEGEGNTARTPRSFGGIKDLRPSPASGQEKPIWPMLLALAVLLFLIERGLTAFGSEKWRS